jgi:hypothetical protein
MVQLNLRRRQIPEDYAVFSRDMEIIISLATGWTDLIQLPYLFWNAILLPPQTSNNRVPEKWYHNNSIHHGCGSSRSRPPPTTISSISTTPHAIVVLYAVIRGRPSRASFPRRRPAAVTFLHSSEAPPHPPCFLLLRCLPFPR